ncbi:MAG: aldehyde dehydrogenase family protein [Myxococcales bacterium]|nr:aldehyde dehydrogenase family protein [Myxococcales bacterium]MDH3844235.1 aldehyde dehydrogenase family protein [Myxococcales bacterium]
MLQQVEEARAPQMLESFNPSNGEKLGEVRISTSADVKATVERARKAQIGWAAMGVDGRNRILDALRGVLIDRASEIARLVSSENGKPPVEPLGLTSPLCETIKLHTRLAKRLEPGVKVSPTFFLGSKARVFYEPLGVAGFILPWNFPFELGVKHMIPALCAGNAVVQKPSEANPLIGEMIADLFRDAGVPDGVVQMVHGHGETGAALIDEVDVICFVGSPRTGRRVMERAAQTLTPVVLELGGNDAAIVREDADLDFTAHGLVYGTCYNTGQVCNGIERIYAPTQLVEPLTEKIITIVKGMRQGDPSGQGEYDLGPITWAPQLKIYEEHTADAVEKGAEVRYGGEVLRQDGGLYWQPTVLTGMTHDMLMMQEETFGPFLPIMAVSSDEEAIRLANDSKYGLGGSIWTRDVAKGEAMARKIRAGSVMVNNAVQSGGCVTLPFGGEGESGVGRVQGEQAFYTYVATKSVMTSPKSVANLWMPYAAGTETLAKGLAKVFSGRRVGERISGLVDVIRNWPRR